MSLEARRLAERLRRLEFEIDRLNRGSRSAQLGRSSVDSGAVIAGQRSDKHVRITKNGVIQYARDGTPITALGAGSLSENFLTVQDIHDPDTTLASVSQTGQISASGLEVNGTFQLNGENVSQALDKRPLGVAVLGSISDASSATTSEIGWFEIAHEATANRAYRMMTSQILSRDGDAGVRVRYTTDGTQPTLSSPILTSTALLQDATGSVQTLYSFSSSVNMRLLLTVVSFTGTSLFVTSPAGDLNTRVWVEDVGPSVEFTGKHTDGGGSEPAPAQTFVEKFPATWSRCFNQHGIRSDNDAMWQGFYPDGFNGENVSMIGFDDAHIRSVLSGATVDSVEVYVYAGHWYYNNGGFVCLGTHDWTSPPGFYPVVNRHLYHWHLPKPGGRWEPVPTFIGEDFRDDRARGLVLDAFAHNRSLSYYGIFSGYAQSAPPAMRITYTK